jgi:hypothetical protein
MSLIVEDGNGLSNAESYASVAYADNYHGSIGNQEWLDLTLAEKEQNLRKATIFLGSRYRGNIKGSRIGAIQRLDFPRKDIVLEYPVANNVVPQDWQDACCVLALKSNAQSLLPDVGQKVIKEKIDVIEITYKDDSTVVPSGAQFVEVDKLLNLYLLNPIGDIKAAISGSNGLATETVARA